MGDEPDGLVPRMLRQIDGIKHRFDLAEAIPA